MQKICVEDVGPLRDWLKENHAQKDSVWLVSWKRNFGKEYINYDEMVDELMCFGWIDSLPKNLNGEQTMHRISPRNPKSNWSKVNKERVTRLTRAGKMEEPGLKMVEIAKISGTWNFLDDLEKLILPDNLKKAFLSNAKARINLKANHPKGRDAGPNDQK